MYHRKMSAMKAISDDQKKLAFAFTQFLETIQAPEKEGLKEISRLISEEFGFDASDAGSAYNAQVDLFQAFHEALQKKDNSDEEEQKFKVFLSLIEKKGFFNGVEPGSDEYKARLERAREKFEKHNNPYYGLTADEVKAKGNELMSQCKYTEAIAAYTKAIELNPENALFFANRSAAYTHIKDYAKAILDSERSIALNPSYAKSYSRLGTALFYDAQYEKAVQAFSKACELDPDNQMYKEDLKRAEDKKKTVAPSGGFPSFPGMPGGMPMPTPEQIAALSSNPQFMEMAQSMMSNPEIMRMMPNFMSGNMSMDELAAQTAVRDDGMVETPFGAISPEALKEFQNNDNPTIQAMRADVMANGPAAMQKYMADPEVLKLMGSVRNAFIPKGSS